MSFPSFERSRNMRAVRSKNTSPELSVRKALHSRGLRFRLHRRDLPGTPDITLPKFKLVIFVHGCFWHQHIGCKRATIPATNQDFWQRKFNANHTRDEIAQNSLIADGWHVATIWECQAKTTETLNNEIDQIFKNLGEKNISL